MLFFHENTAPYWQRGQRGSASLLLQPIVLRPHLILYSMVYVEVLAHQTLLQSHELAAVPGLYMNSRALILSPKLFQFAQNDHAWPRAPYLIELTGLRALGRQSLSPSPRPPFQSALGPGLRLHLLCSVGDRVARWRNLINQQWKTKCSIGYRTSWKGGRERGMRQGRGKNVKWLVVCAGQHFPKGSLSRH